MGGMGYPSSLCVANHESTRLLRYEFTKGKRQKAKKNCGSGGECGSGNVMVVIVVVTVICSGCLQQSKSGYSCIIHSLMFIRVDKSIIDSLDSDRLI